MAGGEGTRLRPLTLTTPKPLLPVCNRPMIGHAVDLLRRHGVDELIVTVSYLAEHIKAYLGDGAEFGVSVVYEDEPTPLGTAGSVGNARELLDQTFLVVSGDVLTDIDLTALMAFHRDHRATATIGLTRVSNPLDFGIVITNPDGTVARFLEKPTWGQVFSDTISTGIYVLEPSVFEHIPTSGRSDFSADVFPALLARGAAIYGAVTDGYWSDVGTLEAYAAAHRDLLDGKVDATIPAFHAGGGLWMGEGATVSPAATVTPPVLVGDGAMVGDGAILGQYTVLGANVQVTGDADLERCVIHDNVYLADQISARNTVIGRGCSVRRNVRLADGVVLGDDVVVGNNVVVSAGVKVFPDKTVEDGALVNSSIVWESRGARRLFGRRGIVGLANVDITADLAVRVAMAYATTMRKGSVIVTSRDSSRAARMLKRAVMTGLNAAGVDVLDLEVGSVPVTRFLARSARASGGFTVRLHPKDPDKVVVRLFDADGLDLGLDEQRKIERLFQREDTRLVLASEIGDIQFPPRALEEYKYALTSTVAPEAIRARTFKLVLDYAFGAVGTVMPTLLGRLGADVLAVNPYLSTSGRIEYDADAALERISALVVSSGAHLGAQLDPDGERLTLVDNQGRVLSHAQAVAAFIDLIPNHLVGDRVVLPPTVSARTTALAASRGITTVTAEMSSAALMEATTRPGVGFGADGAGGFILPGFMPAFDAAAALLKILDLLAREHRQLDQVIDGLPNVEVLHVTVATPFDRKATVMRSLAERAGHRQQRDGVWVAADHGWALVTPDPEDALTHVWAEGRDAAHSATIAAQMIEQIVGFMR